MSKAPAFQWYPKDCDTDEAVRAMTDSQFGLYVRLLNHAWLNDGLPSDLGRLALVMGRSRAYIQRSWPTLAPCFEVRDGRLFNPRQERERAAQVAFTESRRNAAEVRWHSKRTVHAEHVDSTRNARALQVVCSASASSSASSSASAESSPPTPSPTVCDDAQRAFQDFRAQAEAVGMSGSGPDWDEALMEWRRLDWDQRASAGAGIQARVGQTDSPELAALPKNYLGRRMWERSVRLAKGQRLKLPTELGSGCLHCGGVVFERGEYPAGERTVAGLRCVHCGGIRLAAGAASVGAPPATE